MLDKVQPGDWVFTIHSGWEQVKEVRILRGEVWIGCNGCVSAYTRSGKSSEADVYPSAWPENHPEIPHWAPPRPKRKVRKQVEKYVSVYANEETGEEFVGVSLYDSQEEAMDHPTLTVITCVKLKGEYEIEE